MDGAIVCLRIGHWILSLIVMDRKMMVCVRSVVFSCQLHRICGISPMMKATLCLGGKLHIDMTAFLPHAFNASRIVTQSCSTVCQKQRTGKSVNLSLKISGIAIGDKTDYSSIRGVGTVWLDIGICYGIPYSIVRGHVYEHAIYTGTNVSKLGNNIGIRLGFFRAGNNEQCHHK